ncbi:hypothetical protein [Oceanisphaera sp.]|uniref:hypothetical protein n=1 Tax=Oceanisphaera sp. TaxID=1929979 RepID=UPI003A9265EF
MDGRRIRHLGILCPLLFTHINPGFAYDAPAPDMTHSQYQATSSNQSPPDFTLAQPLRFTLAPPVIFGDQPRRYDMNIELRPTPNGMPQLHAYPSLQLTPQSSVGLSLKNLRPRFDFESGGFKTSMRLRGDGIKLNIRPADPDNRLEFDIKITDDESRLDLTYRY